MHPNKKKQVLGTISTTALTFVLLLLPCTLVFCIGCVWYVAVVWDVLWTCSGDTSCRAEFQKSSCVIPFSFRLISIFVSPGSAKQCDKTRWQYCLLFFFSLSFSHSSFVSASSPTEGSAASTGDEADGVDLKTNGTPIVVVVVVVVMLLLTLLLLLSLLFLSSSLLLLIVPQP